mmetsp:Transcript_12848/g.27087  ORF Transcript_12848/g.27087 Transcript_12848/m.27087 type:complete len:425 (+) Transcript_12848:16-1290(+)
MYIIPSCTSYILPLIPRQLQLQLQLGPQKAQIRLLPQRPLRLRQHPPPAPRQRHPRLAQRPLRQPPPIRRGLHPPPALRHRRPLRRPNPPPHRLRRRQLPGLRPPHRPPRGEFRGPLGRGQIPRVEGSQNQPERSVGRVSPGRRAPPSPHGRGVVFEESRRQDGEHQRHDQFDRGGGGGGHRGGQDALVGERGRHGGGADGDGRGGLSQRQSRQRPDSHRRRQQPQPQSQPQRGQRPLGRRARRPLQRIQKTGHEPRRQRTLRPRRIHRRHQQRRLRQTHRPPPRRGRRTRRRRRIPLPPRSRRQRPRPMGGQTPRRRPAEGKRAGGGRLETVRGHVGRERRRRRRLARERRDQVGEESIHAHAGIALRDGRRESPGGFQRIGNDREDRVRGLWGDLQMSLEGDFGRGQVHQGVQNSKGVAVEK